VTLTVSDGALTATASTTVTVTNTAPVANAGGPYTIQKNKSLSFDGSKSADPDGNPLTYAWNFGDGTTGTGVSPAHSYAKGGLYPVTLTVSDNQLTTSVATTVTVTNQVPVASFTAPALVYKNDAVVLNGSASSDADGDTLTYRWNFGSSPQPPSPSSTATTSYTTVGTRVLSLTVNDGEVDSAPATRSITVQSRPPVANAGPDQTVLQRTTVVLSAANSTDPDGVIANVAWRQVSGTAVTLTSVGAQSVSFVAPQANNTGTLTLVFEATVTDNDGVTAADQVTVTVMKRL
jgi:PKD repeat protein